MRIGRPCRDDAASAPDPSAAQSRYKASRGVFKRNEEMSKSSFWWRASAHAERRPFLTQRAALMQAVRRYFAAQGFIEVDPAILQISPGNEAHISAFATELVAPDASRSRLYLHTSPEFAAEKAARRGRGTDLLPVARLPQPRARPAAPSRIHHARMVSRRRAL